MATKKIGIELSPGSSGIETAHGLVLTVVQPRSDRTTTLLVDFSALEYQEELRPAPALEVRQLAEMGQTSDAQKLFFDMDGTAEHSINVRDRAFRLRFLAVGEIIVDGQSFPVYEFEVTDL